MSEMEAYRILAVWRDTQLGDLVVLDRLPTKVDVCKALAAIGVPTCGARNVNRKTHHAAYVLAVVYDILSGRATHLDRVPTPGQIWDAMTKLGVPTTPSRYL